MKKTLLLIAVIIILSGCGTDKTLTCSTDNNLGTVTSNSKYLIEYRDNEVKKLTVTYEYNDNHTDGVGTGTDGTTEDNDLDSKIDDKNDTDMNTDTNNNADDTNTDANDDEVIGGVVGESLDDVITGITDGILDIAGIKTRHDARFGTYTNTEGFMRTIDVDNDTDYKVTYTYDLTKLSDDDITALGISKDFDTLKSNYTNQGLTCKFKFFHIYCISFFFSS